MPAADRARLEQLCRYLLRPPVAQDRLQRLGGDRILLTLKTAWADGTRHLLFAPMELLEKLAALTPRPRINLILYHGVLAPHARWRARVVAYGSLSPAPPRHWAWANLMRRAFDIDVLACPRCGIAEWARRSRGRGRAVRWGRRGAGRAGIADARDNEVGAPSPGGVGECASVPVLCPRVPAATQPDPRQANG